MGKDHLNGLQHQQDPAGDAESIQRDLECCQNSITKQRKSHQNDAGYDNCLPGQSKPLRPPNTSAVSIGPIATSRVAKAVMASSNIVIYCRR